MQPNYYPSINIIRDFNSNLYYIPTPNTQRVFSQIINSYQTGVHAFNIIGTYGTGKSAFLLALKRNLIGRNSYFTQINNHFNGLKRYKFINIIGEYQSLIQTFQDHFKINSNNYNILFKELDKYSNISKKEKSVLILFIDEFGKFLEFAAKNNPEKEMYFIQKLAEYVNDPDKNIILITTLHQSFNAYSQELTNQQRLEWEKVKGRLKEITFNESIDHLLLLAGEYINNKKNIKFTDHYKKIISIIQKSNLLSINYKDLENIAKKIYPFDILSCIMLIYMLQKYGQSERSLFSFLQSDDYLNHKRFDKKDNPYYNIHNIYDYITHHYHFFLSSKNNPDYLLWSILKNAIIRIETLSNKKIHSAIKIVKTIGLLNIIGFENLKINSEFLTLYGNVCLGLTDINKIINNLEKMKIIREIKFKDKLILYEGTDIDIDIEISKAELKVEKTKDISTALKKYFSLYYMPAKSIYYQFGTPRYFTFKLSNTPIETILKTKIDGIINLIFSHKLNIKDVIQISENNKDAILYCFYKNTLKIENVLFEIEKINNVLENIIDDKIAKREIENLLNNQINQLNNLVINNLYNNKDIVWIFNGKKIIIENKKDLNKTLSRICEEIYHKTPIFNNELINKEIVSTSIATARNAFIKRLINNWKEKNLGFADTKFPPEKTIYLSLLKKTGMHLKKDNIYVLNSPFIKDSFMPLWNISEDFLKSAKKNKKNINELIELISEKPFKLKQGLIDFWIPVFLFIKRDDFALYYEDQYVPYINLEIITLLIKHPKKFQIKTFDLNGIKLELFNKYRLLLNKHMEKKITNINFIDTIRPILSFYIQLPEYVKKTKRLSKPSIALREAIAKAKDPEKAFFDDFPYALGFARITAIKSDSVLEDYIKKFKKCIKEIRGSYDELINRIETQLLKILNYKNLTFSEYKDRIEYRYQNLKKYLLLPHQKIFYLRLFSKLNDRKKWLSSIIQVIIGKPIESLNDDDEKLISDKLNYIFHELDNLCDILIDIKNNKYEESIKLEITSLSQGLKNSIIKIPKNENIEINTLEKKIVENLSKNNKLNIIALTKLLQKELEK